mmetsp:Transcript_43709/g.139297  ORF Transcript_43709/g.139297 Transcript_43709/m.139297 type:complete len:214 (-) Transcript_43709:423-1064(-)
MRCRGGWPLYQSRGAQPPMLPAPLKNQFARSSGPGRCTTACAADRRRNGAQGGIFRATTPAPARARRPRSAGCCPRPLRCSASRCWPGGSTRSAGCRPRPRWTSGTRCCAGGCSSRPGGCCPQPRWSSGTRSRSHPWQGSRRGVGRGLPGQPARKWVTASGRQGGEWWAPGTAARGSSGHRCRRAAGAAGTRDGCPPPPVSLPPPPLPSWRSL